MSTLTQEQQQAIATYLEGRNIPSGLGTREAACSIAAINLALTGELTDRVPACMSPIIGRWIINIQDAMPADMRNSDAWRDLLPLAAGTGRNHEGERLTIILEWMWEAVLPTLQPLADQRGFGEQWKTMLAHKTPAAAAAAVDAAADAAAADAAAAAAADVAADVAAYAARAAAYAAADATRAAARAAAYAAADVAAAAADVAAAAAVDAAADAAAAAADAAVDAADVAAYAARAAAYAAWTAFNPSALLRKLIEVTVLCA